MLAVVCEDGTYYLYEVASPLADHHWQEQNADITQLYLFFLLPEVNIIMTRCVFAVLCSLA